MAQELLYTSATRGLKPGSRGFCTVLSTHGMPAPLATAVEGLSGYRPIYPGSDDNSKLNPIVYSHLKLQATGRSWHVLSRIADYGLDYSQRANKLAHHVILDNAAEELPGGPANLLSMPGFMRTEWSGDPKVVDLKPIKHEPPGPSGICRHWEQMTGDAGWAGVLAESFLKDPDRLVILLFQPGQQILPLFAEAIALLPHEERWNVTFSTYFTGLVTGTTCQWRAMLTDSKEAHDSLRFVSALRLDVTQGQIGAAPVGEFVDLARTGDRSPTFKPAIGLSEQTQLPPQLPLFKNTPSPPEAPTRPGLPQKFGDSRLPLEKLTSRYSWGVAIGASTVILGIVLLITLLPGIARKRSPKAEIANSAPISAKPISEVVPKIFSPPAGSDSLGVTESQEESPTQKNSEDLATAAKLPDEAPTDSTTPATSTFDQPQKPTSAVPPVPSSAIVRTSLLTLPEYQRSIDLIQARNERSTVEAKVFLPAWVQLRVTKSKKSSEQSLGILISQKQEEGADLFELIAREPSSPVSMKRLSQGDDCSLLKWSVIQIKQIGTAQQNDLVHTTQAFFTPLPIEVQGKQRHFQKGAHLIQWATELPVVARSLLEFDLSPFSVKVGNRAFVFLPQGRIGESKHRLLNDSISAEIQAICSPLGSLEMMPFEFQVDFQRLDSGLLQINVVFIKYDQQFVRAFELLRKHDKRLEEPVRKAGLFYTPLTKKTLPAEWFANNKNSINRHLAARYPKLIQQIDAGTLQESELEEADAPLFEPYVKLPKIKRALDDLAELNDRLSVAEIVNASISYEATQVGGRDSTQVVLVKIEESAPLTQPPPKGSTPEIGPKSIQEVKP